MSNIDPSGNLSISARGAVISVINTLQKAFSFAFVSAPIAIQNVIIGKGLVPIAILSTYVARLGAPAINRISQTFTRAPQISNHINMWTNAATGARSHFFNEAIRSPQRFQIIANRLQVPQFRWGINGFQRFTNLADQIRKLPIGNSRYGQIYRVTNNNTTITFVRSGGSGNLTGGQTGVLVVEHGGKIASFREGVAQTLLTFRQ